MTQNKIIAIGLTASFSFMFIAEIFGMSGEWYTLSGFGLIIFGIWAIIYLFRKQ